LSSVLSQAIYDKKFKNDDSESQLRVKDHVDDMQGILD
jgi:hypothetical protein